MNDISTPVYSETTNMNNMKDSAVNKNMDTDEEVFYHAICADLDMLYKKPKAQTIDRILEYSKKSR